MSGPFVYILRCADGSYYVGLAQTDLDRRIGEHQSGRYRGYTHSRRPVDLVWAMEYERYEQAIAFERQLKGWSRAKKEAFLRGDFDDLVRRAKRRGGAASPGNGAAATASRLQRFDNPGKPE